MTTTTKRPSANDRGYTSRWRRASEGYRAKHPLCERCKAEGKLTPSQVVDHVKAHRGDKKLFWDSSNWRALCKPCHDKKSEVEEQYGDEMKYDEAGLPAEWR